MREFDDEAAFANEPVAASEADEKAEYVLKALRGAALQPPFRMDDEGSPKEVWGVKLIGIPFPILDAALDQWITNNHEFPDVATFLEVCEEVRLKMAAIGQRTGAQCPECETVDPHEFETMVMPAEPWSKDSVDHVGYVEPDAVGEARRLPPAPRMITRGWVEMITDQGIRALRPCSTCRPKTWEANRAGCFDAGHEHQEDTCNSACPKAPRRRNLARR